MTLHLYFARRFMFMLASVALGIGVTLFFLDFINLLGKSALSEASLTQVFLLTLLTTPQTFYEYIPLIVILGSLTFFLNLSKSSELVVARASGRSALTTLLAPIGMIIVCGVMCLLILNPIVASTLRAYEAHIIQIDPTKNAMSLSSEGLWLRQSVEGVHSVIHAEHSDLEGARLSNVTFVTFDDELSPMSRIESATATLTEGAWQLERATVWPLQSTNVAQTLATNHPIFKIPSNLTQDHLRNSFADPVAISIFKLPSFIHRLQNAGLSGRTHQMWYYNQLSLPLFLISLLLICAGFTLRHYRSSGTGLMVLLSIMISFGFYFLRNFAQILGETGRIPMELAALGAPLAAITFSLTLLLHREES